MSAVEITNLIAQHREEAELGGAVGQLKTNSQFKLVFESNLFNKRVALLVSQLAELPRPSVEYDAVVRELDSISYIQSYLQQVVLKGAEALENIKEAQYYLHNED